MDNHFDTKLFLPTITYNYYSTGGKFPYLNG
jgi:hypothetical protein